MKRTFQTIYSLEYESQLLALICGVAMVRIVVELISDFIEQSRPEVVAINFTIFLLIAMLLYSSIKNNFKSVHFIFGLVLTVLLAIIILIFGGMHGYAKFNYYTSIYFIVMVYTGKNLKVLLALNFLFLILVLAIGLVSPWWLAIVDLGSSYSRLDFWFTLVILSSFSFYLKWITMAQGKMFSELNIKMARQVRESRKLSVMLHRANVELKQTQANLETEVNARTEILAKKNQSTEAYIKLNTTELIEAVDDLLLSMRTLNSTSQYAGMIKVSSEDLATVVEIMRTTLQQNGWIDRKHLRNDERDV